MLLPTLCYELMNIWNDLYEILINYVSFVYVLYFLCVYVYMYICEVTILPLVGSYESSYDPDLTILNQPTDPT
ncbi:unnamed protein product [Trifolium pratense]|uniref:Uncharacterized protein n=1 Tax=Trifolium pratense TaxID=57577 RepID=A0ACB0LRB2_TRIPR|nr:unnamed protein product [Trifolium pratense]